MNAMTTSPDDRFIAGGSDFFPDYHKRRELEEIERAELKRIDVEAQYSPSNSIDLRIRAWEKVHRLSMPFDPGHPVLVAIAAATQLTLEEVQDEQRLRCARLAPAAV